jgi:GntR family transcriptional regulator/MocR family aminotransferase
VSVITVQTAYEQLLAEGYIESRERSGYFVAAPSVNFNGENVEQQEEETPPAPASEHTRLFPFSVWAKLMRETLADCGEHLLERVPADGDWQLKKAIASYLYRARSITVKPQYVVIGAGAEYLYGVVVLLLGREKVFAIENPGYKSIHSSYALNGAQCVFVPVDQNGIRCNELEKLKADVLHLSPSHQFPTGAVTPASSRAKLIDWACEREDRYLVEDDYDSEFRLNGKPLQSLYSLRPDKVIYINTFSKSLAPSMRMGYMILPPKLYEKYCELLGQTANVVPLFEQKTLAKLMESGAFERHINRMKTYYRGVRARVLEKINRLDLPHEVVDTGSGLYLTVRFPTAPDEGSVKALAERAGLKATCMSDYLFEPLEGCERTAVISYSDMPDEKM